MDKRRVITSAEPFGFGPVSKLRTVGKLLRADGWTLDFVGSGTALTYVQNEHGVFSGNTSIDQPSDLLGIDPGKYDVALSVMDPYLAVWATHQDIPCLYVDSLFWFWGWTDQEALKEDWAAVMTPDSTAATSLEELARISMSAAEYVGHRAASRSCVQRTPSTPQVTSAMRDINPIVSTGAIVDLSWRKSTPQHNWMVSLSGLINPLINTDHASLWAEAAVTLIDEAFTLAEVRDTTVYLTGNAEIIAHMPHIPARFEFAERNASAVLNMFNTSFACLTPPGLTTMLESLAYNCPVIPLPPQHYGHDRILNEFSDHHADAFPQSVTANALGVSSTGDPAVDTRTLITGFYAQMSGRTQTWHAMVKSMAANLRAALDSRAALLEKQQSVVNSFVGGFSGAEEVTAALGQLIRGQAPTGDEPYIPNRAINLANCRQFLCTKL